MSIGSEISRKLEPANLSRENLSTVRRLGVRVPCDERMAGGAYNLLLARLRG